MRKLLFIAIAFALLAQFASADCLYKKNKDGYPLGIIPSVNNITAVFPEPSQQNSSFELYIEAEAGTTTSLECRVALTIENETVAMKVELSNYSLESGAAFIERPITVYMVPINTVNFPDLIKTQIKITDIDNPSNYAILPIYAKFTFPRNKPKPSATGAPAIPTGGIGDFPLQTVKPKSTPINTSALTNIIGGVDDSSSKYIMAIVAFLFLGGVLWFGFNSLQRD